MKKVILITASLILAASLMSCQSGGSKSNSDRRTSKIENKAKYIVREAAKATAAGDMDRYYEIVEEEEKFTRNLTEEELKIYNKACIEVAEEFIEENY